MAARKRASSFTKGEIKRSQKIRREENHFTDTSPYRPSTELNIDVYELKDIAHNINESVKHLRKLHDDIIRKRKKTRSKELKGCENMYDFYVNDLTRATKKLKSCLPIQDSDGQEDTGGFGKCMECEQKQHTIKKLESQTKRKGSVDPEKYAIDLSTAESKIFELQNEVDSLTKRVRNEAASREDELRKFYKTHYKEIGYNLMNSCPYYGVYELQKELSSPKRHARDEEASRDDAHGRVYKLQKEVENLTRCVREEVAAKEEALRRLSELVSSKLRDNNPNIADLSDKNRPTKLAEHMSEMYDNEWTEAFDEMDSIFGYMENQIIDILLNAFMDIFAECRRVTTNGFFERVQACIEQTDVMQVATVYDREGLPDTLRQQIKEFRKLRAVQNMDGIVDGILKQQGLKYLCSPPYDTKNVREYLKKCVEVSWLMCVQDPPLTLSTNKPIEFDKALYREYTKRGRYNAFIVWPIVYLHDGGPILCKGVAQGSDEFPQVTPRHDPAARSGPDKKHDMAEFSSPQNQLHSLNATISQVPKPSLKEAPHAYNLGQRNNQLQHRADVAPLQYTSTRQNSRFDDRDRSNYSMGQTQYRPTHHEGRHKYGQQMYANTSPSSMNNTFYRSTAGSYTGTSTDI